MRKGCKATEETKAKMREAQRKRSALRWEEELRRYEEAYPPWKPLGPPPVTARVTRGYEG